MDVPAAWPPAALAIEVPFISLPEPEIYPNSSPVTQIHLETPLRVEIKSDGALLKSARAGFYLGVIIGVVSMSLLVVIAYISFLTNLLY